MFMLLNYASAYELLCASELILCFGPFYVLYLFVFKEFLTIFLISSFCLYFILFIDDKRGSRFI